MPFGIILLPSPELSGRIANYSARIGASASALMTLGDSAPPHVTLCHADCSSDAAELWWSSAKSRIGSSVEVQRTGLVFEAIPAGDSYVPSGGVSAGIAVVRRTEIEKAHQVALAEARKVGAKVMGAVGDDYRPHVTLGILERFPSGAVPFEPEVVSGSMRGTLAFGVLGPYGTFPDIREVAGAR